MHGRKNIKNTKLYFICYYPFSDALVQIPVVSRDRWPLNLLYPLTHSRPYGTPKSALKGYTLFPKHVEGNSVTYILLMNKELYIKVG